ncbi:MAG: PepSY-associated TM helix domain-containing protein [Woeseiaceae bacterium]
MRLVPSSALVRKSLSAHSWTGLMVGALMYLVCLTGTLAVFFEEFERWEQPRVEETLDFDAAALEQTFNDVLASGTEITPHMYLVLPTDSVPRARIASENESWYLNADASIGRAEQNDWTEMLLDLHLYLHLPESWGMILVSALGAMLCGLMLSGLIAHPRIFKDAFNFRLRGSRRLEQADIHNRLSVWGIPFHLMIAVTGAYFGLALPLLAVYANAFQGGNSEAVLQSVFGAEPELRQEAGPLRIASALGELETIAPNAAPFLITAHEVGEPGQYFAVSATLPGRMIYSENYLFGANGNYLRNDGFSDGDTGKQIIYSIYRLHFGHFRGMPVKLLYGILGLALTVVSATGINVWLARRKTRDYLNDLWAGIVWGTPVALVTSAFTQVILQVPSAAIFWVSMLTAAVVSLRLRDAARSTRLLQGAFVIATGVLLAGYFVRFASDALTPAALGMNLALAAVALPFAYLAFRPSLSAAPDALLVKVNENHYH